MLSDVQSVGQIRETLQRIGTTVDFLRSQVTEVKESIKDLAGVVSALHDDFLRHVSEEATLRRDFVAHVATYDVYRATHEKAHDNLEKRQQEDHDAARFWVKVIVAALGITASVVVGILTIVFK